MVLPEERAAARDDAAKYLVQILHAYIEPKDWKRSGSGQGAAHGAQTDPRQLRTEARARFYLGEALG